MGRISYLNQKFQELQSFLMESGARKVLTAYPNCFKLFKVYCKGLSVKTIYEYLAGIDIHQKT